MCRCRAHECHCRFTSASGRFTRWPGSRNEVIVSKIGTLSSLINHPKLVSKQKEGFSEMTTKKAKSTKKVTKGGTRAAGSAVSPPRKTVMWINHFDLLPGDPSVTTTFNAVSSGVGGGLTGLVIHSSTTGEIAQGGGNKVVHMGLQVPPGYLIKGVRVCYELSNKRSFISQIRLAQIQTPPQSAIVRLDDGTDQTNPGPICIDSTSTTVDPGLGEVLLSLRVNFGNTSDRIVVRALGLQLSTV